MSTIATLGSCYYPFCDQTSWHGSVAISSDNKYIVSGGVDKTIPIWDFKTGEEVGYSPLIGHTGYVYSVAITSDNRYIVSGSNDNSIRIWNLALLGYLAQEEDEHKSDNQVF